VRGAVPIFPAGQGAVPVYALSLFTVGVASALLAWATIRLTYAVVAHLSGAALRMGFTIGMAASVDTNDAVLALFVEDTLSR